MRKIKILSLIATMLAAGCVVAPGPGPRAGGVLVPFLPPVVVLGEEPYYSRSRRGPWTDLPRDHYPNEVRHERREHREGWGRDRD
jgi:hypothetical protein